MTDKVVVFVTCGSAPEAERIARALVEERLAACVNISSPIRSVYRWEGKLNDEPEVLLVIKTARALFDRVRRAVEKLHSYQVPEVICLPVIDGAPNYLNWLSSAVATGAAVTLPPKSPKAKPTRRKR
ncbi:MAG: divalent-cation tolerance protein CutA [Acidobacteria bacterium]|nr:divalent-cation tolerance protein CutA [Acidobacteriota bacterium]